MRTLQKLQEAFIHGLKNPATALFLAEIQPHLRVLPETQFTIYRNSIIGRFQKALKDIYPVCYRLVGHDFFMAMALHYIEETPSFSPDLNAYGAAFAEFILQFPPAHALPYLNDVARLEWAWQRLMMAPDNVNFDFAALAACYEQDGENIIFTLPPHCTLLTSSYPVHEIFAANQKEVCDPGTIILEPDRRFYFFVWRKQQELRIDCVNLTEWQILHWLQNGYNLGQVSAQAEIAFPEMDIAALLSNWVANGWIANFIF